MSDTLQTPLPEQPPEPGAELPAASAASARPAKRGSTLREYAESLLVTVILALFGTTFVVQAFKIPSPSMEPTLLVGDHLLVNKFLYGGRGAWYEIFLPYREIRRGDIIVFKFPYDDHPHYVKRVVAVPGDRLKIVTQQVFINGKPLDEPYKVHDGRYDPYADNFPPTRENFLRSAARPEWADRILDYVQDGELVVPPGKYFVMGDNRDSSLDSRFWGFADAESIMGRPVLIYWSIDATSSDYSDRTLRGRLVGLLDTLKRLPKITRWSRMLQLVH
jgi:signal peptidase I